MSSPRPILAGLLAVLALPGIVRASVRATGFPQRSGPPLTGTAFGLRVAELPDQARYEATRDEILRGNIPAFLRRLVPVTLTRPASASPGPKTATVFVTPDYLAVGTDTDYLTVPLDLVDAEQVARSLGFALPTPRVVDAIYAEAAVRLAPITLPPGPEMRSMGYVLEHRTLIEEERLGKPTGVLVAGTKKDLVLTARLRTSPGHEAIYGWQRPDGEPIQPLSLWHGVHYADYSHGVRLVSDTVLVDGHPRTYFDALADPSVAPLLTREGPIPDAEALLRGQDVTGHPDQPPAKGLSDGVR